MDKLIPTLLKIAKDIADLRRDVDDLKRREIPAGVWKSWTPASYEGWTALPTGIYRYLTIGKLVVLKIGMGAGTSNGATAKIGLPIKSVSSGVSMGGANTYAINGGSELTTMSRWAVKVNSDTIDFYSDAASGGWSASGSKRIYCVGFYERE